MRARLLGSIRGESDRRACGAPSDQRDLCQSVAESRGWSRTFCYFRTANIGYWDRRITSASPVATRIEVSKGRCDNGFSSRVAAS